jgi:hypothetical protein
MVPTTRLIREQTSSVVPPTMVLTSAVMDTLPGCMFSMSNIFLGLTMSHPPNYRLVYSKICLKGMRERN